MPVNRTQPGKERAKREVLVLRIKRTSFEMFPCSGYEKRNTKCVVSNKENSNRCLECVF
jgi:hypothetical protein